MVRWVIRERKGVESVVQEVCEFLENKMQQKWFHNKPSVLFSEDGLLKKDER